MLELLTNHANEVYIMLTAHCDQTELEEDGTADSFFHKVTLSCLCVYLKQQNKTCMTCVSNNRVDP